MLWFSCDFHLDNGQLYGFGSNQYGQIGLGDDIKEVNKAYPVLVNITA